MAKQDESPVRILYSTDRAKMYIAIKDKPRATCKTCGTEFTLTRPWRKFCSSQCRWQDFKNKRQGQSPQ